MPIEVPDSSWYKAKSAEADAPSCCPYANVHKCHRYLASLDMLGKVGIITSLSDEKRKALDTFWADSGLLPVIAEDDTGISGTEGNLSVLSNFCPEVSYKFFRYYGSYLARYVDEIDKDSGHRVADREQIPNDWRYEWGFLSACHFLDCAAYNEVQSFNSRGAGKFDGLVHENILALIARMEQCLENADASGVLHASANILETTAKDIIGSDALVDKTLGAFIGKYKKESRLPNEIKDVVENI